MDFYLSFVRVLCEIGLLSFSIRACIGLSTCSLHEVGLVGPETRVFITFVVDALSYVWPLLMALRLICSAYPFCGRSPLGVVGVCDLEADLFCGALLCEVGSVDSEARVLFTLAVGALSCVKSVL